MAVPSSSKQRPWPNRDTPGSEQTELVRLAKRFYLSLRGEDESIFLTDQVSRKIEEFVKRESIAEDEILRSFRKLYRGCQEIILTGDYAYAFLRPRIGIKRYNRLHPEGTEFEQVTSGEYLIAKDEYVQGHEMASKRGLTIDFSSFYESFPKVVDPSEMGTGMAVLNRRLSGELYSNRDRFQNALLKFLGKFELDSYPLFVNDHQMRYESFQEDLEQSRSLLSDYPDEAPYEEVAHELRRCGFEPGWGADVGEIKKNIGLLEKVLQSADPDHVARLLGKLPLVKNILMVSPHGWFAQENVLGKPDTGGQVTYVLDQARSLERQLKDQFSESGLEVTPKIVILTRLITDAENTTCNQVREKVHGTENVWILRVPFRNPEGEIIPHHISRFQIWPYLEGFADEAKQAVLAEFPGIPSLIVGHYSDGNLVAHLLSEVYGTTHCAAVHALEKTKYLFSDLRWADMEQDYHFSLQFTADLISYNSADFVITSSFREIGGTDTEMGMFESYETYSMPGLYRVESGLDPRLARYNIVPPGVNEEHFYPAAEKDRRVEAVRKHLLETTFGGDPGEGSVGRLENPDRPVIFAMSRIDKVKNLAGLVELYGKSKRLRKKANLVIISSETDASRSNDLEEIEQINGIYSLWERYNLDGLFRWRGARLDKVETGEVYRVVADMNGVFVQPALMETFGLTVIEAMACGLPVVVTCFGGPAEIVQPGISGEVENPNDHEAFADAIHRIISDNGVWESRRNEGIERVRSHFTWSSHASKILSLTNLYSYWDSLNVMNRSSLDRYIHTLYHTVYRPRAREMIKGA